MNTYVDDCDLDEAKPLRALIWKVVRTQFGRERPMTNAEISWCRARSPGQSITQPDPKLLPEQPCDPGVRELVGSLLFLSRCTRFDLSFVFARLGRFVTRWCEWAQKDTKHFFRFCRTHS